MDRRVSLLGAVALCLMLGGCTVYGQQKYGPQNLGGIKTLQECMQKAGGPDIMHQVGENTVCVYKSVEGMQVLGVYGTVERKDRVLVFDGKGNLISDDLTAKGQGMFVLGWMSPMFEVSPR